MNSKRPVERIILIGYRGSGKTTAARLVAERLGWSWQDADAVLERKCGHSIRSIFADEGEAGFREKEAAILPELLVPVKQVSATGGGVVLRPENCHRLREAGSVIWLTADAELLWQRLQSDRATAAQRPALTAKDGLTEIRDVLALREPLYRACADFIVDTTHLQPNDVADRIVKELQL